MPVRRVAILTPAFPADEEDTGWLPSLQNFVRALGDRYPDLEIEVFAFHYPPKRKAYSWYHAHVHALGGNHNRFPLRLGTWSRASYGLIRDYVTGPIDVIHSFWLGECTLLGQALSFLMKIPHVATVAGQDTRPDNRYLSLLNLERMTVIAGSDFCADRLREATGHPPNSVQPLGLDAEKIPDFDPQRTRPIDILGVGSLTETKSFIDLVRSIDRLSFTFPNLTVRLIGEGPRRARLERAIRDRRLDDTVELLGRQPRERVLRTMTRSKILLHPARYEAQGYVLLEALASGMYVVKRPVGWKHSTEMMSVCETVPEMVETLQRLLRSRLNFEPVPVPTATTTAECYYELYRALVQERHGTHGSDA